MEEGKDPGFGRDNFPQEKLESITEVQFPNCLPGEGRKFDLEKIGS